MKPAVFSKTQNIQGYLHPREKFAFSKYLFSQRINYLKNIDKASKRDSVEKAATCYLGRDSHYIPEGYVFNPTQAGGPTSFPRGVGAGATPLFSPVAPAWEALEKRAVLEYRE